MPGNPRGDLFSIGLALCDLKAQRDKLRLRVGQLYPVAAEDQQHSGHAYALVSIHKAVILRQPTADSGGLADGPLMGFYPAESRFCAGKGAFRSVPGPARQRSRRNGQSAF